MSIAKTEIFFNVIPTIVLLLFLRTQVGICKDNSETDKDRLQIYNRCSNFTQDRAIQFDNHSILELWDEDGSIPFLERHPSSVLSAAQILYALIKQEGVGVKIITGRGPVGVYNLFSGGSYLSQRRIIGQYEGIERVVESIKAQAMGSRSGNSVPLLVGTHGTGKTEFQKIVKHSLREATRSIPKFYIYELAWRTDRLKMIPNLSSITMTDSEIRSPSHASPVSILPMEMQRSILEKMAPTVEKMLGFKASVDLVPDPMSAKFVEEIMAYVMDKDTAKDALRASILESSGLPIELEEFSSKDFLRVLDYFVTIRRVIFGEGNTTPLLTCQGQEIDWGGLFMTENGLKRTLDGPASVFSWHYNGVVVGSNRSFLFLDEYFRNVPDLWNVYLQIMESRETARGASPTVPIDTVIVAATNSASLDRVKKDEQYNAHLDRMSEIPFEWPIKPTEIAQVLLYMVENSTLMMSPLNQYEPGSNEEEQASYQKIDLDLLFPETKAGHPEITPDRRYRLRLDDQERGVEISPHSLMFMANFIAATRISVSPKSIKDTKTGGGNLGEAIYFDPMLRIKAMNNEIALSESQKRELYVTSKSLREGSFGMSARSAGRWFMGAILEAKKSIHQNTVTPLLLRNVYKQLALENALEIPKGSEDEWSRLMNMVERSLLVPNFERDIYVSLKDDTMLDDIYDEILHEIVALAMDPQATTYDSPNYQKGFIDKKRLEKIEAYYTEKTGRSLDYQQISALWLDQPGMLDFNCNKSARNQFLLDAIASYLASSLDVLVTFKKLLQSVSLENRNPEVKNSQGEPLERNQSSY